MDAYFNKLFNDIAEGLMEDGREVTVDNLMAEIDDQIASHIDAMKDDASEKSYAPTLLEVLETIAWWTWIAWLVGTPRAVIRADFERRRKEDENE
jgi:hypothetical protein